MQNKFPRLIKGSMNQSNDADFPNPPSNNSANANHDERAIEAEIIENEPVSSNNDAKYSQNSSGQQQKNHKVVSLVHQPRQIHRGIFISLSDEIPEGDYIEVAYRTTSSTKECNRLESLVTPWSIAAMLMLLTANILLSVSQWHYSSQLAAQNNSLENATASVEAQQTLSISRNVDLTAKKSDRLDVNVLSLAQGNPTTASVATSIPPARANATAAKTAQSLTQALLPPVPQPQQPQPNIQSYPIPATLPVATSIPAPQQPQSPIAAPPAPVPRQFPFPPPPMAQVPPLAPPNQPLPPSQPATQTVPAPSNAATPVEEFSKRHAAEQQRAEAANRPIPTLYQKTRVEGLARQYQLDPDRLTEQVQQLQTQPTNDVRQSIQNQLPPSPNTASQPSNGKPSIERKSDGSIE
jgi:hypothetical protein